MKVYIADISPLQKEELFYALLERLPAARREAVWKCRRREDQQRSLGAGLLLEYGLNRFGVTLLPGKGLEACSLETDEHGKPFLKERADICFNLSHSGTLVAAVFDAHPVGIDVERVKMDGRNIAERFFCREECQYLEEEQWENCREQKFAELWTRKESYIKAVGGGLRIPLRSFCVLEDEIKQPEPWFLHTCSIGGGYCLSVCGRRPFEAKIETVTFDGEMKKRYNESL